MSEVTLRILVYGPKAEEVRDLLAGEGREVWACGLGVQMRPGLYASGPVELFLNGHVPVRFSGECDPEGTGVCELSGNDVGECPCVGPTQDGVEYVVRRGRILGRPANRRWDYILHTTSPRKRA